MHRASLLSVTAVIEVTTGLLALVSPPVLLALLLGIDQSSPEVIFTGRIASAALLALGVACWFGRCEKGSGLLTSVLIYDASAAVILAFTGLSSILVGIALWPAVALHAALALWCMVCLGHGPAAKSVAVEKEIEVEEIVARRHG
jgi:hypothetical protein